MNENMESNEEIMFKKPMKISDEKTEIQEKESQNVEKIVIDNDSEKCETITESKTVLPEPLTKLLPTNGEYFVDQLKNGTIIEHKLLDKSRITFGRARDCDVVLEHPSISRYHSILLWSPLDDNQYQNGSNKASFWYLIDCGSTHGTNCNKTQIIAGKLIKLIPNNNVFKFGASTRLFSLGSNLEEDQLEDEDIEDLRVTQNVKLKNKTQENVDTGCDWGINEEEIDPEKEETSDSKSLQAIITAMKMNVNGDELKTSNDNVYSANPNKCLQQWFEREGYEMDYKVDAIHNKYKCTFELPIDGQWIPVDGSLMTKKKEAITEACLKSCQLLDRAELLFPWQQQKAKLLRRKQEEDDNDSDGEMIDETVHLSRKRARKESDNNTDNGFDTFETLNKKWSQMNEELRQLRIKLAKIGAKNEVQREVGQEFDDSLDDYMASIGKQKYGLSISDKIEKSNVKMKINQLEKEQQKLEKLIELAKPSVNFPVVFASNNLNNLTTDVKISESLIKTEIQDNVKQELIVIEKSDDKDFKKPENEKQEVSVEKPDLYVKTHSVVKQIKVEKPKNSLELKSNPKLNAHSIVEAIEKEKKLEKKAKEKPSYDNDYVDWLPPIGQSGDGKTQLNERFGY